MSTFLRRFTGKDLNALKALNADVVAHKINLLCARKLTIDVDGTVLCTGKRVGGARRGYNPHHRKVPSYYPITAYLADSGHFLGVHNRPGQRQRWQCLHWVSKGRVFPDQRRAWDTPTPCDSAWMATFSKRMW